MTAIFLHASLDSASIDPVARNLSGVFADITVVATELSKSAISEVPGEKLFLISPQVSVDVREALRRAVEVSPNSEYFLVFTTEDVSTVSAKKLRKAVMAKTDFAAFARGDGLFLSRRYVLHLAQTNEFPSAGNAIKNGFSSPMSIPEIIRSPKAAIRQYWTLLKFVTVGLTGVLVNLGVLALFKPIIGALLANLVSQEASIISNFTWNDRFTFKRSFHPFISRARFLRFVKYNLVCLLSLGVNEAIFYVIYSHGVYYITSSLIATACAFVISYVGSSKWAWSTAKD